VLAFREPRGGIHVNSTFAKASPMLRQGFAKGAKHGAKSESAPNGKQKVPLSCLFSW